MLLKKNNSVFAMVTGLAISAFFLLLQQLKLTAQPSLETEPKAVFLINFLKFTSFPPDHVFAATRKSRILCIGIDPIFQTLVELQGRTNSNIEVELIQRIPEKVEAELLVIGASEAHSAASLLKQVEGASVFTASEIQDFVQHGGMLEFCFATNRINYQINMDEVRSHRLQVSSRLLKLGAGKVEEKR